MRSLSNFLEVFNVKNYTKDKKIKFLALVIMTITLILVRNWTIASYWLIIPIAVNTVLMFCGIMNEFEVIMYSLIMPSEIFNFLGIGIATLSWLFKIAFKKINLNLSKKDNMLFILIIFMLVSAFVSCIVNKTLLSAIFTLGYIFVMFFIYRITVACNYSISKIQKVFNVILIIQLIMMIVQFYYYGIFEPSDSFSGTFVNAHRLCVWLIWCFLINIIAIKERRYILKTDILKLIILLVMIYLTDGKHIVASFIAIALFWFILDKIKYLRDRKVLTTGILILLGLYAVTNISHNNLFKENIKSKSEYVYRYIYEPPYNNKFNYFDKTLNNNLRGYKLLLGFGPGQYGSRVANLRAYEYMVKEDSLAITLSKFIPPHVTEPYKEFAKEYNQEYLDFVKDMSAVLSYPFSSIMAVIAEFGILGYLLYLLFFNSIERNSTNKIYSIFPMVILVLMIFDSYFEMTSVVTFFWIIMGISQNKDEQNRKGTII